MLEAALGDLDVDPKNCMMVGDRLHTDIGMAVNTGMASALVLTGDNTYEDALAAPGSEKPTFAIERIDHLIPAEVRAELGWSDDDPDEA